MSREQFPDRIPESERSLTIPAFCYAEGISEPTYYEMRKKKMGPEELRYLTVVRVTPKARAEWHERMKEAKFQKAAKIEQERRTAIARRGAQASLASEHHVSKRKKKLR
jgi:hypothetical protein